LASFTLFLLGWQFTGFALAVTGILGAKPVAEGAISCLSWQSPGKVCVFGGHRRRNLHLFPPSYVAITG
jgi:hypothetical protein